MIFFLDVLYWGGVGGAIVFFGSHDFSVRVHKFTFDRRNGIAAVLLLALAWPLVLAVGVYLKVRRR